MNTEIGIVLAILAAAIILFSTEKLRPDLVALLVLLAVILTGQVSPQDAFASLGNPAVITVAAILALGYGLQVTGVAHIIGDRIASIAGSQPMRLTVVIMVTVAVLSSFMNNVGAAAVLLPAVVAIGRRARISPSKLLIPLSFGSLAGGMLTLFGTPSNLLVNAILADQGLQQLGMFTVTPVGLIITIISIGYMAVLGRHLLPSRKSTDPFITDDDKDYADTYSLDERLFRIRIPPGSIFIGRTLINSTLRDQWNLNVIGVSRGETQILDPEPTFVLQQGDILLLEGKLDEFKRIDVEPLLEILPEKHFEDADLESTEIGLSEVVVAPRSIYANKTLIETDFREKYHLSVVGIWRGNKPIRTRLGEIPLQVGDALLLQGQRDRFHLLEREPHFLFLDDGEAARERLRPSKAPFAVAAVLAMVVVVLAGWLELPTAAVLAGVFMILFGILTMEEAQQAIDLKAVFIIGSMLPLGMAMERSGAAAYIAQWMTNALSNFGAHGVLAGVVLFAGLAVQVMSNSATAVLVTPIALSAAAALGANPLTFALAVALSASSAYLTPISHQSHLLVMAAGGYRFSDYTKAGALLWLAAQAAIILLVPIVIPLYP
ncbi:MAG: SLC13 family permease [Chloroflexota bacterium]